MKLVNFILLFVFSFISAGCVYIYRNYTWRTMDIYTYSIVDESTSFFQENKLYLQLRNEIGLPYFDKSAEVSIVDKFVMVRNPNVECNITIHPCGVSDLFYGNVSKEFPNVAKYTILYKEESKVYNRTLAEVLSVECNVSLAYDINTKKMLKYEVSAKYYLKNKEGTSEISKQKYLEIKSQWGVK